MEKPKTIEELLRSMQTLHKPVDISGIKLAKTIAVKKSVQDQINALNDLKEVNGEAI